MDRNRFLDARRAANAILVMDSGDTRGWKLLMGISIYTGDSLAMQRDFRQFVSKVPMTNVLNAAGLVSSGRDASRWFLSRGLSQYRISEWTDSLWYYDAKSVASLSLGDQARSRVYSDSVIHLTSQHRLVGFASIENRIGVAYAHANLDDTTSARRELASIVADTRSHEAKQFPVRSIDVIELAAAYARIGDHRDALSWMQATVEGGAGTAQFYLVDPRFRALSQTPEFQKFLREHPLKSR